MTRTARDVALTALVQVEEGAYANVLLPSLLRATAMSPEAVRKVMNRLPKRSKAACGSQHASSGEVVSVNKSCWAQVWPPSKL